MITPMDFVRVALLHARPAVQQLIVRLVMVVSSLECSLGQLVSVMMAILTQGQGLQYAKNAVIDV